MLLMSAVTFAAMTSAAFADITGRNTPAGTSVPNPGTQQQELANITIPAPYNVFEFVVTCGACHGGTIDQQCGHFGNWAGTNMASAARDPVFRANEIIVNNTIKSLTGKDGTGNMCFRCHSPNGWYSGRFDPKLAGGADGSDMIHSILLSTDDEGNLCEMCHRTIGNVTMKRADLDPSDPVWNMMESIDDWPHAGDPYPAGPAVGNPYGDMTLQIDDGMTYGGKYVGSVAMWFSDIPMSGTYTGQTYGVYPTGWPHAGEPVVNPDGSIPIHFEEPIGPPLDYNDQSISIEHPTFQATFVSTPEFCGTCHDLTVPVLNHGMPEQRTYTEWKYSDFATSDIRCQDCHMPTMKHEYSDTSLVSLNPDPTLTGYFPYGKDRNAYGGTTFHKLQGSNRDLPMMMAILYPEVDLEIIGAPTGRDTRIFPGMMSSRDLTWDRAKRNTELHLLDAVTAEITEAPTLIDPIAGTWRVKVKLTNNAGHKIPSGYPDGRRFWISLTVWDESLNLVYESGYYDPHSAQLSNDRTTVDLARALEPTIDSGDNAVMTYEKITGTENPDGSYTPSPSVLNNTILFDNRIPPAGFTYADYQAAGAKFWNYDPADYVPYEDTGRYPDGQNWDEVTYTFTASPSATLRARAEIYGQTHSREFMDYLNATINGLADAGPTPEGPPSIYDPLYPLTPYYLSRSFLTTTGIDFVTLTDLDGNPLKENWGGIAYGAWLLSGKGEPFLLAAADSAVITVPSAPTGVTAAEVDPYSIKVSWNPVTGADGYVVWIRYGLSNTTASWDRLAVLYEDPDTSTTKWEYVNDGLNVGKTYAYDVVAFNAKGSSAASAVATATTPSDMPLFPMNLKVIGVTATTVTLSWYDQSDNEIGFVIERQDVPTNPLTPLPQFVEIARIPSPHPGPVGGVTWTNTGLTSGRAYNYRVAAYNATGLSTWNDNGPVIAVTLVKPPAPSRLTATVISSTKVNLAWTFTGTGILGFHLQRANDSAFTQGLKTFNVAAASRTYSDTTTSGTKTYFYRVTAYNSAGDGPPSNAVMAQTPPRPPVNVRLAPATGTITIETKTALTSIYSDASGSSNLTSVYLLVNPTASGLKAAYFRYDPVANKLYVRNDGDTSWMGGFAPGANGTVASGYCRLYCNQTTVQRSGIYLTVNWKIALKSPYASRPNCIGWMMVSNKNGLKTAWESMATYKVQ